MNSKYYILLIVVVYCRSYYAQDLRSPESIVYDSISKSYFVSNYENGSIIKIDDNGRKSYFKEGLSNLLGLTICKNILFVVELPNKVLGFDLHDNKNNFEIIIEEAHLLNGITNDCYENLYATDIGGNIIYRINIISKFYSVLLETITEAPNGIYYDKNKNRLLVCYFKENASIDEIELDSLTLRTLVSTQYHNFDGITLDENGYCYVSSFGSGNNKVGFNKDGAIYKFDKDFIDKPLLLFDNLNGPADIYYNKIKSELAIPLFFDNEIKFSRMNKL